MIAAVVTTKNEQKTIAKLVYDLREQVDRVIVIDEHSDDYTVPRARVAGAEVYQYEGGIGPCLQRGMWYTQMADRVVTIDAGGSHDTTQLGRLLDQRADVVIGSRFIAGGSHDGNRRYLSRAYGQLWNWNVTGASVKDWTSGYRAYSTKAVEFIVGRTYRARMHAWQAEVLADIHRCSRLSIAEVPIDYRSGDTSMSRDVAWEAVKVLVGT